MAIDTWITVTIDPGAAKKPDRLNHVHIAKRGTAAGGDLTVAFDRAKVGNMSTLRSALSAAVSAIGGGKELTA